jgi:hypothetical protein
MYDAGAYVLLSIRSAAHRKRRGVNTKVLEWRSLNTDSGVEMPDCGRLVKRHRESLERLQTVLLDCLKANH